jgi:hypothetical protein
MKILKTIFLFLALVCAGNSFGQTKEETVKYIDDILKISKGTFEDGRKNRARSYEIIEQRLHSINHIETKSFANFIANGEPHRRDTGSSIVNVPWIAIKSVDLELSDTTSNLTQISINFDVQFIDSDDNQSYSGLSLYVISSKKENFVKAIKHLQELLKKEDPFGN